MIRVNPNGTRDLIPDEELDDLLRVIRTPNYDEPGPIPGSFHALWFSEFLCPSCETWHRDNAGAEFTRETLTELRDEIQRVLDEDAAS